MKNNKKTVESKVANELLQRDEEIVIGGKTYMVAPPTLGTLVDASEEYSKIPHINVSKENLVTDVLREARKARNIARPVAVMILGAERVEKSRRCNHTGFFGKLFRRKKTDIVEDLAHELLLNTRTPELTEAMAKLVMRQDVSDFFALTTFLATINVTSPTKEVETKTTQSGQ